MYKVSWHLVEINSFAKKRAKKRKVDGKWALLCTRTMIVGACLRQIYKVNVNEQYLICYGSAVGATWHLVQCANKVFRQRKQLKNILEYAKWQSIPNHDIAHEFKCTDAKCSSWCVWLCSDLLVSSLDSLDNQMLRKEGKKNYQDFHYHQINQSANMPQRQQWLHGFTPLWQSTQHIAIVALAMQHHR